MKIYFRVYFMQICRICKECEIKFQSLNKEEPICMKWRKKDQIPRDRCTRIKSVLYSSKKSRSRLTVNHFARPLLRFFGHKAIGHYLTKIEGTVVCLSMYPFIKVNNTPLLSFKSKNWTTELSRKIT